MQDAIVVILTHDIAIRKIMFFTLPYITLQVFYTTLSVVFFRIYEKLMVHSDVSKAESWMRLTEEFLNTPLPNTDGTKVWQSRRHRLTENEHLLVE